MRIVINAILYNERPRGVGVYINNLIEELSHIDNINEYYIYYGKWMNEYDFTKINKKNFKLIKSNAPRNKILRNIYQLFIFPFSAMKLKADIIHIPDTSPVLFKTAKIVSTIHDLAEFVYPEKYSTIQALMRRIIVKTQIKFSDKIITVSKYSRDNIINIMEIKKEKITTIYNGVNLEKFYKVNSKIILDKLKLEKEKYILFVGEIERTKNVKIIIDSYKKLENKEDYKIVICGKAGNDYDNIKTLINEDIKKNIVFTGYVSDEELRELYSNAFAFVFPSLFEGFGLPILEALSCETPVISSNKTSLPEVGGEAILTFDPLNDLELVDMIKRIEDENLRRKMKRLGIERLKNFSWEECSKHTKDIYENLIRK